VKTTSRHKRSVMEKMGLRTTQELLEFCQRSGMFTD
jgi:DNA-binding CsgD family transcriptional regulator